VAVQSILRGGLHLSSGHVTLVPRKFYPPPISLNRT